MCCVNTTPTGGQSVSLLVGSELVSHGGGSGSSLDALGLFVFSGFAEEVKTTIPILNIGFN